MTQVSTIGLDIAKNSFAVHGFDAEGRITVDYGDDYGDSDYGDSAFNFQITDYGDSAFNFQAPVIPRQSWIPAFAG